MMKELFQNNFTPSTIFVLITKLIFYNPLINLSKGDKLFLTSTYNIIKCTFTFITLCHHTEEKIAFSAPHARLLIYYFLSGKYNHSVKPLK